jgi:hypothetical protein
MYVNVTLHYGLFTGHSSICISVPVTNFDVNVICITVCPQTSRTSTSVSRCLVGTDGNAGEDVLRGAVRQQTRRGGTDTTTTIDTMTMMTETDTGTWRRDSWTHMTSKFLKTSTAQVSHGLRDKWHPIRYVVHYLGFNHITLQCLCTIKNQSLHASHHK